MRGEGYYVYMLTNAQRSVVYIGVTSDLEGRFYEHRSAETSGFTQRYRVDKLIYYEDYPEILAAIAREKQLKGWTRAKKNALVATLNPCWRDLGEELMQR